MNQAIRNENQNQKSHQRAFHVDSFTVKNWTIICKGNKTLLIPYFNALIFTYINKYRILYNLAATEQVPLLPIILLINHTSIHIYPIRPEARLPNY